MRRGGPLRRRAAMRSAKPRGKGAAWSRSREACETRAGGRCEARCTSECAGRGSQAHHRLMRSQGGADDVSNLLWVCLPCHGYIHAHPAESYNAGWLLRSTGLAS